MSKNSAQPPFSNSIASKPSTAGGQRLNNSRSRFESYRQQVRGKNLPRGRAHSSGEPRDSKTRVRSAKQLVRQFILLLAPFRWQVFWILLSVTIATLIGLLPPAGTKFIV